MAINGIFQDPYHYDKPVPTTEKIEVVREPYPVRWDSSPDPVRQPIPPESKGEDIIIKPPDIPFVERGIELLGKVPVLAGMETVWGAYELALGSPERKADIIEEAVGFKTYRRDPQDPMKPPERIPYSETFEGEDGNGEPWYEKPMVTLPGIDPFKFPDILGGLKGGLIYAALFIGGLYLAGKYLGRGKK